MAEEQSPFAPLDPSRKQIRLLHMQTDPSDLRAALETVSLDDNPRYTALSYTWGAEMCDAHEGIRLNRHASRRPISRNLKAALQHLCSAAGDGALTLWVDAMCINQDDPAEKSHQITLMRDVYTKAEATRVWLGPATEDSDLAMSTIGSLYEQKLYVIPDDALSEAQIIAINSLQRRDWWTRIWVLQEVMLSPNPTVTCGNSTLPFEAFVHLDDIRRGYVRSEKRYLDNTEGMTRFVIQGNPFRIVLTDYPDDKPRVKSGHIPLDSWVPFVDTFNATDQRDKIYGLLGLATDEDVRFIAPDYSKSVAEVYARATVRFITRIHLLRGLQFDNDHKNPAHRLPSWCPDYSSDPDWPQRAYVAITASDDYAACGTWTPHGAPLPGGAWRELHLHGVEVDAVEHAAPNPYMEPYVGHVLAERLANVKARNAQTKANVLLWEQAALDKWGRGGADGGGDDDDDRFPYRRHGMERYEAFWRALMRDRQWDGGVIGSSFARYVDVWLGRADLDAADLEPGADDQEEARRVFVKPFTDCCVSRCHGRSFIVTEKGYIGTAPLNTRMGDKVVAPQGGTVPFIIRGRKEAPREAKGDGEPVKVPCEFVGEACVLGIMEGQSVAGAGGEDIKVFVMT